MKKQTKIELEQERDRLREENTVLSHAVQFLLERKRPNAIETVREKDGGKYAYQAFEVTAPHGGILLVTFYYPGQRPHTSAHYLDRYLRDGRALLEHRVAVDRLRAKARALQRAAWGVEAS
jgi:hypothetical protein